MTNEEIAMVSIGTPWFCHSQWYAYAMWREAGIYPRTPLLGIKDDAELEKVDKWLAANCQGPWFFHFGYIFEEANDAVAFKLAFGGMMMEKHLDDDEYPCP